jgi:formylglycine-generating enzyme required for sulfatase activity
VQVREFFLAQTPITQAQWRAVALWPKVDRLLNPDPSDFKGPNLPVEQVSWFDSMEFCLRLSQRTGRSYGLPSEAQWEYGCRAGTITPFHFGVTLTPEVANYKSNSSYGDGPLGSSRPRTTEVGNFPANAWCLHDMHGNVWEYCTDHWHAGYGSAPADDKPWLIPATGRNELRVHRGGTWRDNPGHCRSAFRGQVLPDLVLDYHGFRVCFLPPGPTS